MFRKKHKHRREELFMMKKGFTLAEVLITLGVLGVVAALSMPALITSLANHKVGPTLSKAVATFGTAVENALVQEEMDSIMSMGTDKFMANFPTYLKIHETTDVAKTLTYYEYLNSSTKKTIEWNGTKKKVECKADETGCTDGKKEITVGDGYTAYEVDGGVSYYIKFDASSSDVAEGFSDIPSNQKIGDVYIDITGPQLPNVQARDLFRFYLYNDGTLRPYGGPDWDRTVQAEGSSMKLWNASSGACAQVSPTKLAAGSDADYCTGSIFANGMKVKYKK